MEDRTCAVDDCDGKRFARDMCSKHYQRAYKAGEFDSDLKRWRRVSLTDIDLEALTVTCEVHGPDARLRVRRTGGSVRYLCRKCDRGARRRGKRGSSGNQRMKARRQRIRQALGSSCAICGSAENLVIDHDHSCCPYKGFCNSCVRGILCRTCNLGLGFFRDDPLLLFAAVNYLAEDARPLAS